MNEMHEHREVILASLGLGSYLAKTIWSLVRALNYSRELLVREQRSNIARLKSEQRRNIERQNELVRTLATAFASGRPPTLDDLLSRAELDWSLKSSKTP